MNLVENSNLEFYTPNASALSIHIKNAKNAKKPFNNLHTKIPIALKLSNAKNFDT